MFLVVYVHELTEGVSSYISILTDAAKLSLDQKPQGLRGVTK